MSFNVNIVYSATCKFSPASTYANPVPIIELLLVPQLHGPREWPRNFTFPFVSRQTQTF